MLLPASVIGKPIVRGSTEAQGLVAYWPMLEGVGRTTFDYSGNNISGARNGSGNVWEPGNQGWSQEFNGTDDYVDTSNIYSLGTTMTAMAWVRFKVLGRATGIVAQDSSSTSVTDWDFGLATDYTTNTKFRWVGGTAADSSYWLVVGDAGTIAVDTWYHVVGTVDGTTARLYVDGVEQGGGFAFSQAIGARHTTEFGRSRFLLREEDLNGFISDIRLYNRNLSVAEIQQIHLDSRKLLQPRAVVVLDAPAAGGDPSITADAGSYSISGDTVGLQYGRSITAAAGSYAITGTAVTLLHDIKLPIDVGSYSITGSAVTLAYDRILDMEAGSYSITGSDAGLLAGFTLVAEAGSYAITGTSVDLEHVKVLQADAGSYAITGTAVDLSYGYKIAADSGSYAITGTNVDFARTYSVEIDSGAYSIAGQNVSLVYSAAPPSAGGSMVTTFPSMRVSVPQGDK